MKDDPISVTFKKDENDFYRFTLVLSKEEKKKEEKEGEIQEEKGEKEVKIEEEKGEEKEEIQEIKEIKIRKESLKDLYYKYNNFKWKLDDDWDPIKLDLDDDEFFRKALLLMIRSYLSL